LFSEGLLSRGARALQAARAKRLRIVTAETCTGGLVSGCLTSVAGASEVFERGFVLYHASAKVTGLGVPEAVANRHGAVSAEVTSGLAEGALAHSTGDVSVAVTGYAGPGGGNEQNPVGTVYIAAASRTKATTVERHHFSGTRDEIRLAAVAAALDLLARQMS
jgi:nicotinamide-nucleotide amidase